MALSLKIVVRSDPYRALVQPHSVSHVAGTNHGSDAYTRFYHLDVIITGIFGDLSLLTYSRSATMS